MGCHFLLQGIFLTQELNLGLLHCRQILYHLSHQIYLGFLYYLSYSEVHFLEYAAAAAKSLQSYLTLCDRIDGSPPGSPVLGVLQAIILEWVAIPSSRGSS